MVNQDFTSFKLKELELNALLEITQAINNNLSEEALYKIYRFTLLANFDIKRLALYVLDDAWYCKVNFGTELDFKAIELPEFFQKLKADHQLEALGNAFDEFGHAFPVLHKKRLLAVVFIGQLNDNANSTFLKALTNIMIVAIENKKMARRELEREAFRKEMEIAKEVQQFLFPKSLPKTRKLDIAASYLPHNQVGGDYYDYIPISDNQFMVCIADVSGKGVPAALIMSNFQASLRTMLKKTTDLEEIVAELNDQVYKNGNAEIFITFFAAIYNYQSQTLTYVNCGHNPPLLKQGDDIMLLEDGTTVLGMFQPLPFLTIGIKSGISSCHLFAYTDGVTETLNPAEEEFGVHRYMELVRKCCIDDLNVFNNTVLQALEEFKATSPYRDDITLLSCKVDTY